MASKGRKSATPASGRPASPLSPVRTSRLQEKAELQNLNDRLAAYIDRVRHLEGENGRLYREVQTAQETVRHEVDSIKSIYDRELSDARRLLDETHKEKARVEIDVKRLWADNEELKAALTKKGQDLLLADNSVRTLETHNNELRAKLERAQADARKALADWREADNERQKLRKQAEELRQQLEGEALARVDVENANQSLREELTFKDQVYERRLVETRSKRQVEISEIDGRLSEQYEAKLQRALQDLREQYEGQMATNRREIELLYETKLKNLQSAADRHTGTAASAVEELRQSRTRLDLLSGRVAELENQNALLLARSRDLERQLESERLRHAEDLALLDAELTRLREEMSDQLQEYQDLMDVKVALDLEIAAYRKMLESEEDRLNIAAAGVAAEPGETDSAAASGSRSGSSQRRSTPGRPAAKRKRALLEESRQLDSSHFAVSSSSKGQVEISEVDPEGDFVRLRNKGAKEQPLGGWQLVRKAGDRETLYKFHRSVKLEPEAHVTVWSGNIGKDHEPPTNLVMKSQRWFVSDDMTTVLLDSDGGQVARSERSKKQFKSSTIAHRRSSRSPPGTEELHHQQADPQRDDKCLIM